MKVVQQYPCLYDKFSTDLKDKFKKVNEISWWVKLTTISAILWKLKFSDKNDRKDRSLIHMQPATEYVYGERPNLLSS